MVLYQIKKIRQHLPQIIFAGIVSNWATREKSITLQKEIVFCLKKNELLKAKRKPDTNREEKKRSAKETRVKRGF